MAHNRSSSKIRSDVLGADLAIYRGWLLEIECKGGGCPVGRSHRVEVLARVYPDATVGHVVGRLKCLACGRGPESVVLVEARLARRVPLRGPEVSY